MVEEDILNNQPCGAGREAPTRSRMTIFVTKREKEVEDASIRDEAGEGGRVLSIASHIDKDRKVVTNL